MVVTSAGCLERGEVLTSIDSTTEDTTATSPEDATDPTDTTDESPEGATDPPSDASDLPSDGATDLPNEGNTAETDTADSTPNGVFDVAAGTAHSCGILDGSLYCWGENSSGQLGLGDARERTQKAQLTESSNWLAVTAGETHSCALEENGNVHCWGGNDRGQLGQGDRMSRSSPTLVSLPSAATQISGDHNHTCSVLDGGALYCWGENEEGQLGQDDTYPADNDTAADGLEPMRVGEKSWRMVDTGQGHTCAVREDGTLWCWGRNTGGPLGVAEPEQIRYPVQIGSDDDWTRAEAGQHHSCGLRNGQLYCWGRNNGISDDSGAVFGAPAPVQTETPLRIGDFDDWTAITTNTFHGCGLRGSELWCWGRAIEGQLGLSGIDVRTEAERVGSGFQKVAAGRFHSCVLTADNSIQCAGENYDGRLGTGDLERRQEFTRIAE